MGIQNPSAPLRAQSGDAADGCDETPMMFGVVHETTRHTCCFTVVGNHLAQHPELSLLAIGLGVHIQSLPAGAKVDIKTLAARFPEGRAKVAAGLRELETHHYLRREHHRTTGSRIITRTFFRNQPAPCRHQAQRSASAGQPGHRALPASRPHQRSQQVQPCAQGQSVQEPQLRPEATRDSSEPGSGSEPEPYEGPFEGPFEEPDSAALESEPVDEQDAERQPRAPRKKRPLPVMPKPLYPTPALLQQATDILTGLQHRDHRLALSAIHTAHLAPAVATWLERDTTPAAISYALTSGIRSDEIVRCPAAFLAYRLIVQLPAPQLFHKPAPEPPAPMRTCDRCGLAYRSPQPNACPCRTRTRPTSPPRSDTPDYSAQEPLSDAAARIKQRVERLAREAHQQAASTAREAP